jgi:glutamate racemase
MNKANSPIGIFDSGIGGLTVANAIRNVLPNESLIYFGDTAHLPYGEKSAEAIKSYSIKICEFLLEKKCKIIVIACNTASSMAYETVKEVVGNRALVVDVINPVAQAVSQAFNNIKIGVIATKGTIRSDVYAKKIKAENPGLSVASLATPLLVPMIEEGFFNNKISNTIINSYLSHPKIKNIQALILACTHYPLIRNEIETYYKGAVNIIDSAEIVAVFVQKKLEENNLLTQQKVPKHNFFVSDFTDSFEQSTKLFFKGKIKIEYYPMWA